MQNKKATIVAFLFWANGYMGVDDEERKIDYTIERLMIEMRML
ncbi:hypothetical protein [Alkalihalobacillus pseudalcaliphilus]|nr:hypothetical protein [Alkalihalobacillus pseudalcaliphilus]